MRIIFELCWLSWSFGQRWRVRERRSFTFRMYFGYLKVHILSMNGCSSLCTPVVFEYIFYAEAFIHRDMENLGLFEKSVLYIGRLDESIPLLWGPISVANALRENRSLLNVTNISAQTTKFIVHSASVIKHKNSVSVKYKIRNSQNKICLHIK